MRCPSAPSRTSSTVRQPGPACPFRTAQAAGPQPGHRPGLSIIGFSLPAALLPAGELSLIAHRPRSRHARRRADPDHPEAGIDCPSRRNGAVLAGSWPRCPISSTCGSAGAADGAAIAVAAQFVNGLLVTGSSCRRSSSRSAAQRVTRSRSIYAQGQTIQLSPGTFLL